MKTVDINNENNECASLVRSAISEIFDLSQPNHLVLTPGILVGLSMLIGGLDVKNVAASPYEYYDEYHFPSSKVGSFDFETVSEDISRSRPDIAILSLVTWRGKVLPVNHVFRQIRATLGKSAPLLIADCAHAGAIGFPSMNELEADIICGDICKWITPADWQRNLAFLWFRDQSLWEHAARIFRPYYLATQQERTHLLARWIDPHEIKMLCDSLIATGLSRNKLARRHQSNIEMASKLSRRLGLAEPPESAILLVDDESVSNTPLEELEMSGLAWKPSDGGVRILCRSEEESIRKLMASLNSEKAIYISDPPVGCI